MCDHEMNKVNQDLIYLIRRFDRPDMGYRLEVLKILRQLHSIEWLLEAFQKDQIQDPIIAEYVNLLGGGMDTAR